jgi:uncharacterized protein (DUF433 family)
VKRSTEGSRPHVVSVRIRPDQLKRLTRLGRRLDKLPSEAASILIEEGLRRSEFALIDFHSSPIGRQAFVQGTRIAVWQLILLAKHYHMDVSKIADHLACPDLWVEAALDYYKAFPLEIDAMLNEQEGVSFLQLRQLLPQTQVYEVGDSSAVVAERDLGGYVSKPKSRREKSSGAGRKTGSDRKK